MNTQQQAYINGFVKRASEYGINQNEAIELLKSAGPQVTPQDVNTVGAGLSTKAKGPIGATHSGGIETMPDSLKQKLRLPAVPPR